MGSLNAAGNSLSSLEGILEGPDDLFVLRDLISDKTSFFVVGLKKKDSRIGFFR